MRGSKEQKNSSADSSEKASPHRQPRGGRVECCSWKQPSGGAHSLGQTLQTVKAPCGLAFISCEGLFLILEISFHLNLPLVKIEKLTALGSQAIQLVQKHPNVSVVSIITVYQKAL